MVNVNEIIIAAIGLLSSVISACVSWFLARKKYNSEVDHNVIENMHDSLEFYRKLSDDNKVRLEEVFERNKGLESEIQELRKQMLDLTLNICLDLTCRRRIRKQIEEVSHGKGKDRFSETPSPGSRRCEFAEEE